MRTYPTGYTPDQEATLLGAKCYRNTFGMFVHASRNVVVKGGLFADNMIGVDIDRDDNTRLVDSKVVGESVSYRNLMVAKQQSDKVCNSPHVGVELHTQLLTAKNKAIAIDNVEFSFFSHIRCNDAVPFSLDSSVCESILILCSGRLGNLDSQYQNIIFFHRLKQGCLIPSRQYEKLHSPTMTVTI